jgi:putative membrane protein
VSLIAKLLIGFVALEHVYFLYLEMFAWTQSSTRKIFGTTAEFAQASKALAMNQGLYNGFLVVGLVLSLFHNEANGHRIAYLFLSFVLVAGIFGGITANRRILYVQAAPALIALLVVHFLG